MTSPCLVLDLSRVADAHAAVRSTLPGADVWYAVKANPHPEVVRTLVELGSGFDVASPGEVDLCLSLGADPARISYGNPIKKRADVAHAHAAGVRTYVTDSPRDVDAIAAAAPGARLVARIFVPDDGSRTPFGRKFGCAPAEAAGLLARGSEQGLVADAIAFHCGSQQLDTAAYARGVRAAAAVARDVADAGGRVRLLDLGGGFPVAYREPVPPFAAYAAVVADTLRDAWPGEPPALAIEPGRLLVAEAGVIECEVVLVAERDGRRWVYLDVGRYSGLAETENEMIAYEVVADRDGPLGPVVLAGSTCDGDDVLYQRTACSLPLALEPGDRVEIRACGAYTASYASVGFNGFPPLATRCVGVRAVAR